MLNDNPCGDGNLLLY